MKPSIDARMMSVFDDRRKVLELVHLVAGGVLVFFIFVHLYSGCCYSLSAVQASLAAMMFINWFRLRAGADLAGIENLLMAGCIILFSALFIFESLENTGIYWLAGFPFVAYFIHPANIARYWMAVYIGILMAVAISVLAGLMVLPYSTTQILCITSVVMVFSALAHIYKTQLELRQSQLAETNSQLEDYRKRMQVILDHAPIGIWMVDSNLNFKFVNSTCSTWGRISEEQLQQIKTSSLPVPNELAEKWMASDQKCLDSEKPYHGLEKIDVDGVIRTFEVIKVKVTGNRGKLLGIVGFAIDVSDKLKAEEEQRSLEQQVQHSQRLEALGIMAGGIAHDFNNLLTAIQGSIELAQMEAGANESMQESLSCIHSAATAATDLCRQMLAYSGRGILKVEPINVKELIEGMRPLLEVSVGKHIDLDIRYEHCSGMIEGDKSQMSQVILNLVTNAAEAIGDKRNGLIRLALQHLELKEAKVNALSGVDMQPGCHMVVTIEDNGCGMDDEVIEHMFDPFFSTKFAGRGLGLSAILGILRSHHAGIEVKSSPGKGSSISVWIPCYCRQQPTEVASEKVAPHQPQKRKVLVVDDEVAVLNVARRMLERLGQTVVPASSGREALELFSREKDFDWVLLDVTMPEMDGVTCLRALREVDPDIYVTMSSGYDAESALKGVAGCLPNDFLSKPYSIDALSGVIERANEAKGD